MNCTEACPKELEPSRAIKMVRLIMLKIEMPGGLPAHQASSIKKGEKK
jgi:heterodisulfide reductase subunit C